MTLPPDGLAAQVAERYTIQRELGHGGMATVYLARDLRHDRLVALKVLRPDLAHALGPERFLREITLTSRLDHPGILPLLDSGGGDGFLYYTMPFVEGESLRDRLNREKQLPLGDALRIAREVGDALGYAHAHGIVHRDIKPENILLSAKHARVADFGIALAAAAAGGKTMTETGLAIGTMAYMSPEQATGGKDIDGRSDIYSLGCVIYEMLAGEPPFTAPNPQALLARKSLDKAQSLRLIRPAVPAHVDRAVLVAIAPVAADRHATTADFVDRLGEQEPQSTFAGPAGGRPRLQVLMLVGLVALATMLGGFWSVWSRAAPPAPETVPTSSLGSVISPDRIAVFPFLVNDSELAHLREGLMDLVSSEIDGAGAIRRVDPYALMSRLGDDKVTEVADLRTAGRIARDLGAGRFLLGRVVPSGRSVTILASLYASDDSVEPEHQFRQVGSRDSTSALIAALARDILLHLPTGPGTWATEATGAAAIGSAALREYSRGELLMRRLKQDTAAIAFRRALAADSTFALAWLRLAIAEDFRLNDSSMVAAIDRAMHHAERLSPRDRMLAEAIHANYHGDRNDAERNALTLASAYPGYGEAWYQLALSQYWYAWQHGRSPIHAVPALEKALAVDPDHRQSLHLLSRLAEFDGNFARAESLEVRAWGHRWSLPPYEERAFSTYMKDAASFNTSKVIFLVYSTAGRTDRLHHASRIAKELTETGRRPHELSSIGHLLTGQIEAAAGRWNSANDAFHDAEAAGQGVGVLERGWIAALPFLGVDERTRRSLRDSLSKWRPPAAYLARPRSRQDGQFPFMGLLIPPPWLVPHARHYVLGLLSAGLGDESHAIRYAALLRNAAEPADSIGLLGDLALEVRALLAMQQGDTSTALAILDSAELRVASRYQVFESPFHTRPVTRLLRAEALAATGREREALGWYSALSWIDPAFALLAWTNLRQGELYEELGERSRAAYHYRRFVARWTGADSAHQALVRDVRRRLARLGETPS